MTPLDVSVLAPPTRRTFHRHRRCHRRRWFRTQNTLLNVFMLTTDAAAASTTVGINQKVLNDCNTDLHLAASLVTIQAL